LRRVVITNSTRGELRADETSWTRKRAGVGLYKVKSGDLFGAGPVCVERKKRSVDRKKRSEERKKDWERGWEGKLGLENNVETLRGRTLSLWKGWGVRGSEREEKKGDDSLQRSTKFLGKVR